MKQHTIAFSIEHVVSVADFFDKGCEHEEAFELACDIGTGYKSFKELVNAQAAVRMIDVTCVEFVECDSNNPTHAGAYFNMTGTVILDTSHPQYRQALVEIGIAEEG